MALKRRGWRILAAALGIALGILIWRLDFPSWKRLDVEKLTQVPRSTVLYDRNGERFGALHTAQNRVWIELEDVPVHVREAFLAAEDLRFYQHAGFDLTRIFGALWADIKSMSLKQGASTITQQLIKLTHLTGEKTLSRKAQEVVLAVQLERVMEKDDILECYLNTVYFGNGAYGIETAAQAYFGLGAGELSLAQGALLAGVVKSPSGYAPHIQPERAVARRDHILKTMAENGFISDGEAQKAQSEALELTGETRAQGSWYADRVLREAEEALNLTAEEILSGGYAVYTAYDPSIQAAMDALFENGANFPDPASDGTPCQAAMAALDADTGGMLALCGGREYAVRRGLNRATDIARQPGSAFKPVSTYAAAVERLRLIPSSLLDDTPQVFPGGYAPGNAGGSYYGEVTMREALSRSLNVATVDLARRVGIDEVREMAQNFGLPLTQSDANLSLALGSLTEGVSPAQLCAAYCALANGGLRVAPHAVIRIEDGDGNTRYEAPPAGGRAVSPETAAILTDMLSTAAQTGSAKALAASGVPVAGKTGTVSMEDGQTRDVWTCAYTPRMALCCWMGFDQPDADHALASWQGGSGFPARLCAALLANLDLPQTSFSLPGGLRRALVDGYALEERNLVLLASKDTPGQYLTEEIFFADALPSETTSLWDAPLPPTDLVLSPRADGIELTFTGLDANAEYLVVRRNSEGQAEILGGATAGAGDVARFLDDRANAMAYYEYSLLPRNALLWKAGEEVCGAESERVIYAPGGAVGEWINRLMTEGEDVPESAETPLFSQH